MQPKSYRKEKLPKLLEHLAAEFILKESNGASLITVTNSEISQNKKRVTIFFTVLPEEKESPVLEFLQRRKKDFSEYVDLHARIGRMPLIQFAIDKGEKNRQKIDFLLNNN